MNFDKKNYPKLIKVIFSFLFVIATGYQSFAQEITDEVPGQEVYLVNNFLAPGDVAPQFPGGMQKFYNFIGKKFKAPRNKNIQGKILVEFIIDSDGTLGNIKVLRDIGHGTGEEAIRVLKKSPKWIPGKQDGKPVRVMYSLPIAITAQ